MLSRINKLIESVVHKFKTKYFVLDIKCPEVNFDWDAYDVREIQKTTNELRNTLVDIPYFFSYEEDEE